MDYRLELAEMRLLLFVSVVVLVVSLATAGKGGKRKTSMVSFLLYALYPRSIYIHIRPASA